MSPKSSPHRRRRPLAALGVLFVSLLLVLLPAATSSAAGGEKIDDFTAAYDLQPDGSMDVTERITWTFPSGSQQHGIYRDIVVRMGYQDQADRYRYYELTDVAVTSPSGAPDAVELIDRGDATRLRIGSPDEYTSGTQVYDVSYTLRNVANPIAADQTVELYYNVFGADETTPRDKVTVTVTAPAAATKVACYVGVSRSSTPCQGSGGDPATFSATSLGPGDAMSVLASYPAAAFDPGLAADVRGSDGVSDFGASVEPAVNAAAWVGGIGAPVIAAGVMGLLVWTRGRDERYADLTPGLTPAPGTVPGQATTRGGKQVVAVQFHPPKGVQPGMVGVIIDETANPIDVSATVIDLAVRGFLQIEETDPAGAFSRTDWTLTRLAEPAGERLLPYERTLLDGVFSSGQDVVTLSGLKNHFASTLTSVQSQMYDEVVTRHWFRSSPQTQRSMWQGLGIFLAVVGGVFLFFGHSLVASLVGGSFSGGIALGVGLVLAGGITWLLGSKMAAKTAEGSAVLAQSLGFKEYLTTAEASQIAFEEASNIFSRYLPYAVVFGVADRWATTFAEVAKAAEAANQPLIMPTWYLWSGATFPDFTGIAHGVDSFSTTSTGTFTSTPGSSGASGFSGGGGFSAGGGGGSSSGSW